MHREWTTFGRDSLFRRRSPILFALLLAICLLPEGGLVASAEETGLPIVLPAEAGLDANRLQQMEPLIEQALGDKKMPGCVVCIGRHGKIAWLKAYGQRQLVPEPLPMTTDTVFDLASITKPVATATSIMLLIEKKQLRLEQTVAEIIPAFGVHGKQAITVQDLLLHRSGLLADNALRDYADGKPKAMERICELKLLNPVGEKFVYSDVNFIVLGELVERISGQSLQEFTHKSLYEPLGMAETGYLPGPDLRSRIAPTQPKNGEWIPGRVHDPRADAMGGIAGHAGLFSTAHDLAIFSQMLLNQGTYGERRVLAAETVQQMTTGREIPSGRRCLGWDQQTRFSINRGQSFSDKSFGHGGFTGTVLWIDPEKDLFFIFLSNRVHPDGKGLVNPLAGQLATIVGEAVTAPAAAAKQ